MSNSLYIDVLDLVGKWGNSNTCADCDFDFDNQEDREGEEYQVPLQMFRGEGEQTQMLALCWKCATIRMQKKTLN